MKGIRKSSKTGGTRSKSVVVRHMSATGLKAARELKDVNISLTPKRLKGDKAVQIKRAVKAYYIG